MRIKEIWIARTHYDGDDWGLDGVYVGFTRADVEAQIVEVFNEDVREEAKEAGTEPDYYTTLEQVINDQDGLFHVDIEAQARVVEIPASALVKE